MDASTLEPYLLKIHIMLSIQSKRNESVCVLHSAQPKPGNNPQTGQRGKQQIHSYHGVLLSIQKGYTTVSHTTEMNIPGNV